MRRRIIGSAIAPDPKLAKRSSDLALAALDPTRRAHSVPPIIQQDRQCLPHLERIIRLIKRPVPSLDQFCQTAKSRRDGPMPNRLASSTGGGRISTSNGRTKAAAFRNLPLR
jgi:hypothetical protein